MTANIVFTGIGPFPCSQAPVTQTASFAALSPLEIPTLSNVGLALLGIVLAGTALLVLKID